MFDLALVPPASQFYAQEFSRLSRPSRGWVQVRCCFHEDRHPSLSLNLREGNFCCHACGAKGGDVLDFLQLRDGVDFKTAAQRLGAWRGEAEGAPEKRNRQRQKRERDRVHRVAGEREAEVKELLIGTQNYLHNLDSMERSVSEQMQHASGEELEKLWESLSLIHDERREASASYALLAFGSKDDRFRFAVNPDSRVELIERVLIPVLLPEGALLPSGVRDDDGRFREVSVE